MGPKVPIGKNIPPASVTYKLAADNRLAFSPLAATKMAYMNAGNNEDLFFKALSHTDSYYVNGDSMQLIRARMAPMARFVAVTPR